ncbi:MAG: PilZ domain-containing protein [Pseudomonadota bacterium]
MTNLLVRKGLIPPTQIPYIYAAEEDRCAPRHDVLIPSRMRFTGSNSFSVNVVNISLAGFACDALLQIHSGTRCWLTLPGLGALEASVVHHNNEGLGCAFENMLNPAVLDRYVTHYPVPELEDDIE